jgi:hypothetical protein
MAVSCPPFGYRPVSRRLLRLVWLLSGLVPNRPIPNMLPRGTRLHGLAAASSVCPSGASRLRLGRLLHRRNIGTLNPKRLTSADIVNMSGMKSYRIKPGQDKVSFICRGKSPLAFPDGTQGFLYFIPGPTHAPVAGEVRFRTTTGPDPTGFAHGRDLLLPDMPVPWSISLVNLLSSEKKYGHLCSVIFEQDESAALELARAIREHKDALLKRNSQVVHSLGQPFILDASDTEVNIRVASGNRLRDDLRLNLPHDMRGELGKSLRGRQYTGASSQSVSQKGTTYQWMCRFDQVQPRSPQSQRVSGNRHPCSGDHSAHQACTG